MRITYTYRGKEVVFECEKNQVIIGRPKEGATVDLDLSPDQTASRPHARVWVEKGQFWIEDLNSRRGTQVNGDEIKGKRRLQADDTIRIGETTLRVEIPTEPVDRNAPLPNDTPKARADIKIAEVLDACVAALPPVGGTTDTRKRLELLYELPLRFAAETQLGELLKLIVERVVDIIPGAKRGALLLKDQTTGQLLLKAHLPKDGASVSTSIAHQAIEKREAIIWSQGAGLSESDGQPAGALPPSVVDHHIESAMYVPLLWKGEALGVVCVDSPEPKTDFGGDDLRLLLAVAQQAAMAVANHQLKDDLRRNAELLQRLLTNFSPKIRERLLEKARRGRLRPGGEKSEVTILCSDIRGFTRISAGMEADDVVDMLNSYFPALTEVIFKYDGAIDKFVGDAILAVFGSPEPDNEQHQKAVRAAFAMQAVMKELNAGRSARSQVTCEIGIGVHCGEVLHGFIGSNERMEFTVIGDVVNRAARYCDGAPAGEVLISPEVYQRVFRIVQAESTTIKTKHEGDLAVYRVKALTA